MLAPLSPRVILTLSYITLVFAGTYSQTESISGSGFLNSFDYQTIQDPTHGRVRYVDAGTSARENLTYASGDHFVLRADYQKTLDPNGPGRDSVRLQSKKKYTRSVMAFNIRHMPQGCGTWPAVWTVGDNWPNQGEIDIVEGVNDKSPNQISLHTGSGCTMPSSRAQTGSPAGPNNCDSYATGNTGCGVRSNDQRSFGPLFNSKGGGWYTVERTDNFIKVWFWSREDGNVPSDVRNGANSVNTDGWGTPVAYYPSTSCSLNSHVGPHNIIINVDFCGDWAGNVYSSSGCPSTCVDYVNKNPSAFKNAYFDFQWLKIYT